MYPYKYAARQPRSKWVPTLQKHEWITKLQMWQWKWNNRSFFAGMQWIQNSQKQTDKCLKISSTNTHYHSGNIDEWRPLVDPDWKCKNHKIKYRLYQGNQKIWLVTLNLCQEASIHSAPKAINRKLTFYACSYYLSLWYVFYFYMYVLAYSAYTFYILFYSLLVFTPSVFTSVNCM